MRIENTPERLEEYRQRYGFRVYAYVLMSNHVHLLIQTEAVALSRIMQGLQLNTRDTTTRNTKSRTLISGPLQVHFV
jgi:REP element-mobilizing transposase RayT